MKLLNVENHFLDISELHRVHVIEAGNRQGPCVVFMHGGPGAGVNEKLINYIDCEYFHVLLIDQRGCGQSLPLGELRDNTLTSLISDVEVVREHFGINSWWVTGGSWGSFLALNYAVKHRDCVKGLIVRGCFLGRQWELDWLYAPDGASRYYPEVWQLFVENCPRKTRTEILAFYMERLTSSDEAERWDAAKRWLAWASISMGDITTLVAESQSDSLIAKATIMCHYLSNDCFSRDSEHLLTQLTTMDNIPIWIAHGRLDVICPPKTAWELSQVHDNTYLTLLDGVGHSPADTSICDALRDCFEKIKNDNQV
ncbi:prolyl aminopeptidase [Kangiella japonica]|uniref:Proline iminopeptidase n=1 Tax=Kangiella japonica TaxID=647384 RepID=A0ABN0SWH8_9GAMM